MKKTKLLVSGVCRDILKKPGKYPCAACCSGVGSNFIQCSQCMLSAHNTDSGITNVADLNSVCYRCSGEARPIDGKTVTKMDDDGTMLDGEATFCYLGDMLCSVRGWDSAVAATCCTGLAIFQEILACPNRQIPLTWETQQGGRGLRSLGYAPR